MNKQGDVGATADAAATDASNADAGSTMAA